MSAIRAFFGDRFLRRPARRRTVAEHLAALDKGGGALIKRARRAAPSDQNRTWLRHIIGIERWGQRRLATILGEPAVDDQYDGYQPDATLDWAALRQELSRTRLETIALGRKIDERGIGDDRTARHNDLGAMNAREWLQYLNTHSRVEGLRLR
jgi:hypothetical protein